MAATDANRAKNLIKKRQKEQEDLEIKKQKILEDMKMGELKTKFLVHSNELESKIKASTVGLVTLDEMKSRQEEITKQRDLELLNDKKNNTPATISKEETKKKDAIKRNLLTFDIEEDDEVPDEVAQPKKIKMTKCPDVDTSFLPDKERDEQEAILREQFRQEWIDQQAKLKEEEMAVVYSYWDGSGHRRQIKLKKGNTIKEFLQRSLEQLKKEFNELKVVSVDKLMYIKEDIIIPHNYTFYDFIVNKARGKSGPLFNFNAVDDVRMVNDATREKVDSHAGKICLRNWYDRNKHIFPANRWEPYDPHKTWDKYTISDTIKKERND